MSNTTHTKPAAILQLEKELGIELEQVALDQVMDLNSRNSFALSQQGEIIALKLYLIRNKINVYNLNCLKHLTQLIFLDLTSDQVSDFNQLKYLTTLTSLRLNSKQFGNNLNLLAYLTKLTKLSLSCDKLSKLSSLQNLTNLTNLTLYNGMIDNINSLQYLTKLSYINLDTNQISNVDPLKYLTQLTSLHLNNNQINNISSLQYLTKLSYINLDANQISEVTLSFLNCFPNLKFLGFYDNPIQNIPKEIFHRDLAYNVLNGVRHYLEDIEKGQRKVYQAKVILIGNGRVGKTCLVKRWLDKTFDEKEPSTHAIQLRRYFLKQLAKEQGFDDIQLQIWDFGGQDIYHATHRLFMQTRALFILVWDQQTENALSQTEKLGDNSEITYQNYPLRYWLDYAKNLGNDSPILIVQTKKNRDGKCEIKDWNGLNKNYNIIDAIAVESSKEKYNGFDQFKSCLEEQIEKMLKETCTTLPNSWWKAQLDIQKLQSKSTKNITVDKFQKICEKYDLNKDHAKTLLQYLHDTGLLFYRENLFQNQIIIDQKWAIDAVYTLFDRKGLFPRLVQKGIFSTQDLKYAWQDFSQTEQELCLNFMESCEICFEIDFDYKKPFEERQFLAPALLPENKPIELNKVWQHLDNKRIIRYQYRFLHYGNLQSFIVRTNEWSNHASLWKNGCQLTDEHGNLALIEGHFHKEKQYLEIQITGKNPQKLLDKIRNELEKIQQYDKVSELWSIDGVSFVEREKVEQHPKENPKISTIDGKWLNYTDFALFLNKNPEETFFMPSSLDEQQIKSLQEILKIAFNKRETLEKAKLLETRAEEILRIDHQLDELNQNIKKHEKELAKLTGGKPTSRREPVKKPKSPQPEIHLHITDSHLTGNVLNLGIIRGQVQNSIQQMPATNSEQTQLKETLSKLQQWVEKLPDKAAKPEDKADILQHIEKIAEVSQKPKDKQDQGVIRTALKVFKGFKSDVAETISDSKTLLTEFDDLVAHIKSLFP